MLKYLHIILFVGGYDLWLHIYHWKLLLINSFKEAEQIWMNYFIICNRSTWIQFENAFWSRSYYFHKTKNNNRVTFPQVHVWNHSYLNKSYYAPNDSWPDRQLLKNKQLPKLTQKRVGTSHQILKHVSQSRLSRTQFEIET